MLPASPSTAASSIPSREIPWRATPRPALSVRRQTNTSVNDIIRGERTQLCVDRAVEPLSLSIGSPRRRLQPSTAKKSASKRAVKYRFAPPSRYLNCSRDRKHYSGDRCCGVDEIGRASCRERV